MKNLISAVLGVAGVSLILGIVSRLMMRPIPIAPGGIEAETFMAFASTCFLAAIALLLLQIAKDKL